MSGDWTTIGAIAQVFDGPHATPKKIDEGPYFLSISSLENGKLDLSKSARVSEEQFKKWTKRVTPREGDVLFSYETRLGEAALMPDGITACLGRRMGLLRPDTSKVDPRFLLFAYLGPAFQQEIRTRTNYGATVERIALKELPDFPIQIPSLKEQKAIAHILGTLDDKIELNRRMNATLEAMAQALFKSWFVDFDPVIDNAVATGNPIPETLHTHAEARKALGDQRKPLPEAIQKQFPSRFVFNEEMGWMPEGWKTAPLSDFGGIVCGKTPSKSNPENFGGEIPFIKIPDMHNEMFVVRPTDYLSETGAATQPKKSIPRGSVCVSCIATVGKVVITTQESHTNQQINSIVPNQDWITPYLYFYMLTLNKLFHDLASGGSATLNMNTGVFSKIEIIKPDDAFLKAFNNTAEGMTKKIETNLLEIETLSKLRDTLLPKLLSGELRIPDAEKRVAEAI